MRTRVNVHPYQKVTFFLTVIYRDLTVDNGEPLLPVVDRRKTVINGSVNNRYQRKKRY